MYNDERAGVGTRKTLARRKDIPTPARGNEKKKKYSKINYLMIYVSR